MTDRPRNTLSPTTSPLAPRAWAAPLIIVVSGVAAYASSFAGVFLFDDRLHILTRRVSTLWEALGRRRPVVDYSLAINHALGGESAWGYHFVNLVIHIAAGLTLYGVIRRTIELKQQVEIRTHAAARFAMIVAVLWTLHPLHTQSVTYVIQRAESLMGCLYLLTLYCAIRGAGARFGRGWCIASVVFCAIGMGTKAVIITAPFVIMLYDRMFLFDSIREAMQRRWRLYLGLVLTWGVLIGVGVAKGVLNPSATSAGVGFGVKGITPIEYALTQFGVLVHYLFLSLWPAPLCLDYGWPVASSVHSVVLPLLVIATALVLTVWAMRRRPLLGFAGAWFFMVLIPTSTIVPIKDPIFEHRMYLSLIGVLCVMVYGGGLVIRHIAARCSLGFVAHAQLAVYMVAAIFLGLGTHMRNRVYHDETQMWLDVRRKQPESERAAANYGTLLIAEGDITGALASLGDAVRINPLGADSFNGLGLAQVANEQAEDALASFREAIRLAPAHHQARVNLGKILGELGRTSEAMEQFRIALKYHPDDVRAALELGNALFVTGKTAEAIIQYRTVLSIDPTQVGALANLGAAFINEGRSEEAVAVLRRAIAIDPLKHTAHSGLGIALISLGRRSEAIESFRRAVALNPQFVAAQYNLGMALESDGQLGKAMDAYRRTLELRPTHAEAREALMAASKKSAQPSQSGE